MCILLINLWQGYVSWERFMACALEFVNDDRWSTKSTRCKTSLPPSLPHSFPLQFEAKNKNKRWKTVAVVFIVLYYFIPRSLLHQSSNWIHQNAPNERRRKRVAAQEKGWKSTQRIKERKEIVETRVGEREGTNLSSVQVRQKGKKRVIIVDHLRVPCIYVFCLGETQTQTTRGREDHHLLLPLLKLSE